MAIKIANVSGNIPNINADPEGFTCAIMGDDESLTCELNLSKTPFDFKFTTPPSSIDLVLDGVDGLPTITGVVGTNDEGDVVITCTLSAPLVLITGHLQDAALTYMTGTFIYNE